MSFLGHPGTPIHRSLFLPLTPHATPTPSPTTGWLNPNSTRMALAGGYANSKLIQNNAVVAPPKPLTSSVIERYRAALKEREDEIRASMPDDDDVIVLPPSMDEIVRLYELLLSDLTFNSKPIITDLTIIAGEQREHGEGIAHAICSRILEVVFYSALFF